MAILRMIELAFDNRYTRELPGDQSLNPQPRHTPGVCWSAVLPTPVAAPRLLVHSPEMAALLDLDSVTLHTPEMVEALAGNRLLAGMTSYATCYGGHQFGHWAGQLGDGRVIYLGEVINTVGQRWELQLKGAGPTPYSRRADGRAVLRSSIREFLCSEAMHHLGVPTTRALSVVTSGEMVMRDMFYDGHPQPEPGAIVCRVAPSFIRFGHFEILAARREHALLTQLADFTIARDFPALAGSPPRLYADWYKVICARTAYLMAQWMRVGFVHGVMNTDNMSILGLTIDYGPYGWIDDYDAQWTPNTTDAEGRRYCFGRQPAIARWNLERLGEALSSLLSAEAREAGLATYEAAYGEYLAGFMQAKFGLPSMIDEDAELVNEAFELMQRGAVDMTLFFRALATIDLAAPQVASLREAFYQPALYEESQAAFSHWLERYAGRLRATNIDPRERAARMNAVNPRFVLRNYLAHQAIAQAEQGDASLINELLEVLRRPYDEQPAQAAFSAKRPEWARHQPGCSMLSCSS